NWLSTRLIRALYGVRMTDLGPFRAILWDRLLELKMGDPDFGWTVEMQVKAARRGLAYREVPVSYR
ncbi:MAG: glycosyltransferase family 2 protein, partial [Acidobacteria bacterium]|nr:glycosyltransferase family 2 protein [Acidobacteriota bacterium]NIQ30193.1 glycosyltransferase family 2 protein [Acidobacteriota bacterium]NIQ86242.1 glycosyltransferase family 2 protein [Acidobacteriota bacterium]